MAKGIIKNKIALLLTATIDPGDIVFVERRCPQIRENDYINALEKWVQTNISSIIFCENSNYNSEKIKNLLKSQTILKTEYLGFNGQTFPKELGKGYGELIIIKYALQNSSIINDCEFVIKVTGRYFIKNIKKIIDILARDKDVYIMADLRRNLTWADSRVFAFKPSFVLDYLSKYQDMINDSKGVYLEYVLARAILRAISDGHKWIPLPTKPIIIGYSGTSNIPYRTTKIRWLFGEAIHRMKNYLMEKQ